MATVVHGACSSPRQQHQCDLTAGPGGCFAAGGGGQHPHQHPHQVATPIYSSIAKYLRPNTAPQLSTPHPHIYDGNSVSVSAGQHGQLQFGTPLNQISYIPISHASPPLPLQHSYGTAQLTTASPIVSGNGGGEMCRNYWSHSHAATMNYGGIGGGGGGGCGISGNNVGGRHNSKRKSAVQLLAESKPMYMQPDQIIIDRLQSTASPAPSFRKSFLPNSNLKRGRSSVPPSGRDQIKYNSGGYVGVGFGGGGLPSSHSSGDVERRFLPRPPTTAAATRDVSIMQGASHLHHQQHQHHHYHNHNVSSLSRHSTPTYNNNMLQNKIKLRITPDASRERLPIGGSHAAELPRKFNFNTPMGGDNCSTESTLPYMHRKEIVALPPPMFLSTPNFEDNYSYVAVETSSIDEPLVLTDDYRPISPPAEYAAEATQTSTDIRDRYNYQRSYSHSHEVTGDGKYDANVFNINSHKSLPDLHSQISRHSPHSEILSCCSRGNRSIKSTGESSLNRDSGGSSGHYTHHSEPCYRQRDVERESSYEPNSAVAFCNHAVISAAVNAAPVEFRRDSGSSTQHSANSYCGYASPSAYVRAGAECIACRCNRSASVYEANCDYMLNFPTPIVPEAFQDDYRPPSPQLQLPTPQSGRIKLGEVRYYSASSIDHRATQQQQQSQLYGASPHSLTHSNLRLPQSACNAQSPGSTPSMEDISPPPIQFKRQKCIRLKNRNRLPVPANAVSVCNSASAVNGSSGAASYGHGEPQAFLFPKCIAGNGGGGGGGGGGGVILDEYNRCTRSSYGNNSRRPSCEKVTTTPPLPPLMQPCNMGSGVGDYEQPPYAVQCYLRENDIVSDLERFFDRLGLNDEKFYEVYAAPRRKHSNATDSDDSSTVFFSDVSTVDSMRLPDSTETQPQITQPYRPSEPPSIVERNARIIKWLCNIRKLEHN